MNPALHPMFFGDWRRALFIHYETDAEVLQRQVPFELDLWRGSALVSVVAFSMRRFRPVFAGRLLEKFFQPVANHEFLNVRTYVRVGSKVGIYFMTEWVNSRLSLLLGPRMYGLPYRHGAIALEHLHEEGWVAGRVAGSFSYEGRLSTGTQFQPCHPGTVDEFLLERYSAFTCCRGTKRFFDIWHEPWLQSRVDVDVRDDLLNGSGPWFDCARRIGANYSPGVCDIQMGPPRRLKTNTRQCFAPPPASVSMSVRE